jgi:hypothetical protein
VHSSKQREREVCGRDPQEGGDAQGAVSTQNKVCCPHKAWCVVHTEHGALSTQSKVRCPHRARCVVHTEHGALYTQSMVRCPHGARCVVRIAEVVGVSLIFSFGL